MKNVLIQIKENVTNTMRLATFGDSIPETYRGTSIETIVTKILLRPIISAIVEAQITSICLPKTDDVNITFSAPTLENFDFAENQNTEFSITKISEDANTLAAQLAIKEGLSRINKQKTTVKRLSKIMSLVQTEHLSLQERDRLIHTTHFTNNFTFQEIKYRLQKR